MYLKSITLRNVRCFRKLDVDFSKTPQYSEKTGKQLPSSKGNRKWTIVLGENGVGKSTLMRSCALIMAGSGSLYDLLGDPASWIRVGEKRCRIDAVFENQEGEEREIYLEINAKDKPTDVILRSELSLKPLNDALEYTDRNYFLVGYGSSRRLADDASVRGKSEFRSVRSSSVATLFDVDAELNPLETWAMGLDYRSKGAGMKTVKLVLDNFLPGMKFHRIDRRNGQLLFKTPNGIVPLKYLSDGYQNVAAWVGDLMYRITSVFEDYNNPLDVRCLLIIDEVDLHLHPKWQRSLYRFLNKKLPNCQMLVSTHSAVTAQQARNDEVYYLKRKRSSVSMYPLVGDPSEMLVSQLLVSEAFGLESEESVDLMEQRRNYRRLRDKTERSAAEEKRLEALSRNIRNKLGERASAPKSKRLQLLEEFESQRLSELNS